MQINQILDRDRILCNAPGSSKKKALENIADFLHSRLPEIDSDELFEQLVAREKLGSTAIGKGVAIPHCRCQWVQQTVGCLVKMHEPIDFDAADNLPVDLLFVLIVPEQATDEHLQTLAQLAQLFDQSEFRNALRKAQTRDELFAAANRFDKVA